MVEGVRIFLARFLRGDIDWRTFPFLEKSGIAN